MLMPEKRTEMVELNYTPYSWDKASRKPKGPKAHRPHSSPQATDDHRLLEREDHGGDSTGKASS